MKMEKMSPIYKNEIEPLKRSSPPDDIEKNNKNDDNNEND